MGQNAAAEWVTGSLLTKGAITAQALTTGATFDIDVECGGDTRLNIMADMTAAVAGDLDVRVFPFESDNVTPMVGLLLDPMQSDGPTLVGGNALLTQVYDVSGFGKIRIRIKNNNAGTQTINRLSWRLS